MTELPAARDLINGQFSVPSTVLTSTVDDPNTEAVLEVQIATHLDAVVTAVKTAHRVHGNRTWLDLGVEGRAEALERFAEELGVRAQAIGEVESLNPGIITSVARPMAGGCADQVRGIVEQLRRDGDGIDLPGKGTGGPVRLRRDPWGPALVLAPWNAPSPTAVGKTAAAMAAGCPVILKASEWAPGSSRLIAEAADAAGLPAGVFQLVHGGAEVGAALASDPRIRAISMTGGQAAGRAIAVSSAPNFTRLQLELGGNNPVIVMADADLEATARSLATGMTKLNGQWCEAPGKLFVPTHLHDSLVEALIAALAELVIGSSESATSDIGPLAFREHRDVVLTQIAALVAQGGRAITSHEDVPSKGWFLSPTVIVGASAQSASGEVFGPVVTVHTYGELEEAVRLAGDSADGLAGYVFGADTSHAIAIGSRLPGGEIKVNGTSLFDLTAESHQSFWGQSGYGGHGSGEAFEFFRGNRIVGVDNSEAPI